MSNNIKKKDRSIGGSWCMSNAKLKLSLGIIYRHYGEPAALWPIKTGPGAEIIGSD